MTDLNLMIAIKGNEEDNEDNNDLNLFLNNNKSTYKNVEQNGQHDIGKLNSLLQTISFIEDDKEEENDNLFGESIQNISEIKNNNSTLLFGADDVNLKN